MKSPALRRAGIVLVAASTTALVLAGCAGSSGGTATGLRASSTATIVKKQLLAWRTSLLRMFSASSG